MADEIRFNRSLLRLVKADITDLEIEAFLFYAQPDLALGSGFGGAIAVRGGPSIQEELKGHGTANTTEAVVSKAGNMKADYIVHAVGPRFQEEGMDEKMRATILNALKAAEGKGIKRIAVPPMGAGFYGYPLPASAGMTVRCAMDYLQGETGIEEVVLCANDNRELKAFQEQFAAVQVAG